MWVRCKICVCMVAHTLCPHITPKPGSQATSERYAHTGASHRALRMLLQPTALIWVPEQCSGSMLRLHLAHACCNSHICTPYTRMCFCLMGQISAPRSHLAQRRLAAMQSTCKTDPRVNSSGCAVHVQGVTVTPEACGSGAKFVCVWWHIHCVHTLPRSLVLRLQVSVMRIPVLPIEPCVCSCSLQLSFGCPSNAQGACYAYILRMHAATRTFAHHIHVCVFVLWDKFRHQGAIWHNGD